MFYDLSGCQPAQVSELQRRLVGPDYIYSPGPPIAVCGRQCSSVLFSFSQHMKVHYQCVKDRLIFRAKYPNTTFRQSVAAPGQGGGPADYSAFMRRYFVFPQHLGQKFEDFARDCYDVRRQCYKIVAIIDFEGYDSNEISEVGVAIIDLQQRQLLMQYQTIVKRKDYSKAPDLRSANYVYHRVTGIPYQNTVAYQQQIQTFTDYSDFLNQLNELDRKYMPEAYFAKGARMEKRTLGLLLKRDVQVREVAPLLYCQVQRVVDSSYQAQDRLKGEHKCPFHKKARGKYASQYHCALEDVMLYACLLTDTK